MRNTKMGLAIASAIMAGAVYGQDAPTEIEQITVVGVRSALENALDNKRNADTIMDGISADDIGSYGRIWCTGELSRAVVLC